MSVLDQIERDAKNLREYVDFLNSSVGEIQADPRWSDSYKQQMANQRRAYWQTEAKKAAAATWQRHQKRLRDLDERVRQANAAKDEGVNFARLQTLKDEVAAQLRMPENPAVGDTVARRIHSIADRARRTGDREALRAVRIASADYIGRMPAEGTDRTILSEVRRGFGADLEAEWRDVRQAETDLKQAQAATDYLYNTLITTERDLYGLRDDGPFRILTDWQRSIVGETNENTGRVVWRDEATENYMNQPAPAAKPSGIE